MGESLNRQRPFKTARESSRKGKSAHEGKGESGTARSGGRRDVLIDVLECRERDHQDQLSTVSTVSI
jgi:hypothetical protein